MLVLDKKTGEPVQISVIKSVEAGTYTDERGFERENWVATALQTKSLSELLDQYEDIVSSSIENVHQGDKTTVVVECASEDAAKDIFERLLAWKRLTDRGFRFDEFSHTSDGVVEITGFFPPEYRFNKHDTNDLNIIFSEN